MGKAKSVWEWVLHASLVLRGRKWQDTVTFIAFRGLVSVGVVDAPGFGRRRPSRSSVIWVSSFFSFAKSRRVDLSKFREEVDTVYHGLIVATSISGLVLLLSIRWCFLCWRLAGQYFPSTELHIISIFFFGTERVKSRRKIPLVISLFFLSCSLLLIFYTANYLIIFSLFLLGGVRVYAFISETAWSAFDSDLVWCDDRC